MSTAQFTVPLIVVLPGQLISASLWNSEFVNLFTNINPAGVGAYSDTDTQMRTQVDPYPSSVISHATSLAGELSRLRFALNGITGQTYWYQPPTLSIASFLSTYDAHTHDGTTHEGPQLTASAFADGTITDVKIADLSASKITGTLVTAQIGALQITDALINDVSFSKISDLDLPYDYRRPNLTFNSVTSVDVEVNTGTANTTKIVFRDGAVLSVTENLASTTKYRRFTITTTANFITGTEASGLYTGLSESANTWYAIYAVRSQIDTTKFVLVGDPTAPIQANWSALDSRYGEWGWVYLGTIRNGDNKSATTDILSFNQCGSRMSFKNVFTTTSDATIVLPGIEIATSAGIATLVWTYATGNGAVQVPANFVQGDIVATGNSTDAARGLISNAANTAYYQGGTLGTHAVMGASNLPLAGGLGFTLGGTSKGIALYGFTDSSLS